MSIIRQHVLDGAIVRARAGGEYRSGDSGVQCMQCSNYTYFFCPTTFIPQCLACNLCGREQEFVGGQRQCNYCEQYFDSGFSLRTHNYCGACIGNVAQVCWGCSQIVNPNITRRSGQTETYLRASGSPSLYMMVCSDCDWTDPDACYSCNSGYFDRETLILDGEPKKICSRCVSNHRVVKCHECQSYLDNSRSSALYHPTIRDGMHYICGPCCQSRGLCGTCGAGLNVGDDPRFCSECASEFMRELVMPHNENVLNHVGFKGNTPNFLGVELELEWDKNKEQSMELAVGVARRLVRNTGIVKYDGSLNCGIEIVSAPMSLTAHRQANWARKLEVLSGAFKAEATCGLHVHTSRQPINDRGIDKLIKFIYDGENRLFIKNIARRENERYARMTYRNTDNARNNRYQALNLTNEHTVEFRMFAATFDPTEFYGSIEFSHALTRFANSKRLMESDMTHTQFSNYVNGFKRSYPNLKELLKRVPEVAPEGGFRVRRRPSRSSVWNEQAYVIRTRIAPNGLLVTDYSDGLTVRTNLI